MRKNFDDEEIKLFRKVYAEGKAEGEFDIDNVDLVADITHYCIKGLEVPYIYGRIAHGMTEEATKPQVAKVVYHRPRLRPGGVKAKSYASNAADFAQTEKVVKQVKEEFGPIDILVNNAGITKDGLMLRMSEQWGRRYRS